jgi:hypothetical protein
MYIKVRIGKHLSDNFPTQNGLKQGDVLLPLLFNFALEYVRHVQRVDRGTIFGRSHRPIRKLYVKSM